MKHSVLMSKFNGHIATPTTNKRMSNIAAKGSSKISAHVRQSSVSGCWIVAMYDLQMVNVASLNLPL
jgi:hypothetical protein